MVNAGRVFGFILINRLAQIQPSATAEPSSDNAPFKQLGTKIAAFPFNAQTVIINPGNRTLFH
jgi:hypothetical protein